MPVLPDARTRRFGENGLVVGGDQYSHIYAEGANANIGNCDRKEQQKKGTGYKNGLCVSGVAVCLSYSARAWRPWADEPRRVCKMTCVLLSGVDRCPYAQTIVGIYHPSTTFHMPTSPGYPDDMEAMMASLGA